MNLDKRVTVISEENINGLTALYGAMDSNDLKRIVNKHVAVAVKEIKEDNGMANLEPRCSECNHVKCYAVRQQMYYCDHEDRTDDMGKLGTDQIPEISPEWCPKRK